MTLNVGSVTLTDQEQDEVTATWSGVFDRAYQDLSLEGFNPLNTKEAAPYPDVTPDDYANIEGEEYTTLMATVDYWFSRAKEKLGWVEAELICREGEFRDVVRGIKNALREQARLIPKKTERPTETDLKEQAESYPYPRQLQQRIIYLKAKKMVYDNRIDALERLAAGLSRQVTLRGQNIDIQGTGQPRRHPGSFR